ncbi:kinase-like domain-containing protein [Glomus cerebriforme]|uniref:Kinase-like domain-containing protein n=1 Tax=Glomus cerebriforme TaxID=658196 RepID=A0A397SUR4_9GLOM|nr:kinase-like domain-containing protein [Glomus cerebriforme]
MPKSFSKSSEGNIDVNKSLTIGSDFTDFTMRNIESERKSDSQNKVSAVQTSVLGISIKMDEGDVIGPYLPLIQTATNLITKIIETCEDAEYNKKICDALVDRVELTKFSIESLQRRKQKNEKKLRDEVFYNAFHKFIYVLEEINTYTTDISKIQCFKKYTKASSIKKKFIKLTEDYDKAMNDLHFTMAVANDEQKKTDKEALEEDLAEFKNVRQVVGEIYHEIMYIKNHINDKVLHGANEISSGDLVSPTQGSPDDFRCRKNSNIVVVRKKIFNGQEVACKTISMSEEKMKAHLEILKILMKLSECEHILKFYGVSKIENYNVMVFEWAKFGTLKELYEKYDIHWHYKVRIALKICRGLIFLQKSSILHHDLKCENILVKENLEPKIYNLELARAFTGNTTLLGDGMNDAVRWLAPEKLKDYKTRYTTHCEIFSFGVLLWELAFEKVPYESLEVDQIKDFVIKGGREVIKFGDSTPEISKLQEEYKRIIEHTWKDIPQERISFLKALDMLEELHSSIQNMFDENLQFDFDGSKDSLIIPDDLIIQIIPLVKGILAFRMGDHQKAWECFDYHASNGSITAKYWKGRYLWDGYLDNIKGREEEGKALLKEAADEGIPDAQLRYAFTLLEVLDEGDNRKIFMDYITKAATEGDNDVAQFNLGDIYYKGKCKIPKDEDKGIKWLKMAALRNNTKAIDLLKQIGINIYDISK